MPATSVLLEFQYSQLDSPSPTPQWFSIWIPVDDAMDIKVFTQSLVEELTLCKIQVHSDILADLRARLVEAHVAAQAPPGLESAAVGLLLQNLDELPELQPDDASSFSHYASRLLNGVSQTFVPVEQSCSSCQQEYVCTCATAAAAAAAAFNQNASSDS